MIKDLFGILVTVNVNCNSCDIGDVSAENNSWELVEECSENTDGSKMIYNVTLNDYENVCGSCTIYTVLFVIAYLSLFIFSVT